MHFKENKEEYKRKGIFCLLILLTGILQNTGGLFPKFFGVSAMLLIPLTVSIAMFSNDINGMAFGLIAGAIWDFYSVNVDGYYAILLTATGYFVSYLIARYMRNSVITALFFNVVVSFVCATLYWLLFVVTASFQGSVKVYVRYYLISIAFTVALSPLYYFFIKTIVLKYRKEEESAE